MKEEEIVRKIEKIENSCINTAKNENNELKKENDEIEKKLLDEKIANYEAELEKKLTSEFGKMLRDYNKNIFEYSMDSQKKITQFKDTLVLNIYKVLIQRFLDFTESPEYLEFLKNNIRQVLEKVEEPENCKIFITAKDIKRYREELMTEFCIDIDEISDENIGGCMLVNIKEKISMDNTLKNNIYEKAKEITIK